MQHYNLSKVKPVFFTIIFCLLILALSGCHVNGHYVRDKDKDRYTEAIDSRQHITRENAKEAMDLYERLYARNSGDKKIVVKYAEALRKAGYLKQADTVLSPLVNVGTGNNASILLEYAAVKIELGQFLHASHAVERVMELSESRKKDYIHEAHNLRGVILSASGEHEVAEESYREALSLWKGDPSSVMNNLALSLVEQGHFDGAIEMLRQASGLSTNPAIFEKNIQFVEALRNNVVPTP